MVGSSKASRLALVSSMGVALTACDLLLVDPAPEAPVEALISLDVGPQLAVTEGSNGQFGVRELHLRLLHDGVLRDTVVIGADGDDGLSARVRLRPDEVRQGLEIRVGLAIRGNLLWGRGSGTVEPVGIMPRAHIELTQEQVAAAYIGDHRVAISYLDGSSRTVIENLEPYDLEWSPLPTGPLLYEAGGPIRTVVADPYTEAGLVLAGGGRWPAYSADGRWVYYSQTGSGNSLARVRPNGTDAETVLLASEGQYFSMPDPSHDGTRIAYARAISPDLTGTLHVLDLRTGVSTPLGDSIAGGAPQWSPDDQWIAYVPIPRPSPLRMIRADGTDDREITELHRPVHQIYGWTRDSKSIIAASEIYNAAFMVDVMTGEITELPGLGTVYGVTLTP